jgi:hypothetical protein
MAFCYVTATDRSFKYLFASMNHALQTRTPSLGAVSSKAELGGHLSQMHIPGRTRSFAAICQNDRYRGKDGRLFESFLAIKGADVQKCRKTPLLTGVTSTTDESTSLM